MDQNFDHQKSLSKRKFWYSNNCSHFLKCAGPLQICFLRKYKTKILTKLISYYLRKKFKIVNTPPHIFFQRLTCFKLPALMKYATNNDKSVWASAIKLHTLVINTATQQASGFVSGSYFHPSLIFVIHSGAYPSGALRLRFYLC